MCPISSTSCYTSFSQMYMSTFYSSYSSTIQTFKISFYHNFSPPPPHLTPSEFEVKIWSHCQLNKFDEKPFPYIHCQKYQKPFQKELSHVVINILLTIHTLAVFPHTLKLSSLRKYFLFSSLSTN